MPAIYPNQRRVTINKTPCSGSKVKKCIIELTALQTAKEMLSYSEFFLYIYFAQNNQDFEVYPTYQDIGMSKETYLKAFKGLENKGYILPGTTKTKYIFYDKPRKKPLQALSK